MYCETVNISVKLARLAFYQKSHVFILQLPKKQFRYASEFTTRAELEALALDLDSLTTSHPVSVDVDDPKEIEAIFDTISYKKGSSIIHMLESFLGEAELRAGLKQYLSQHR